MKKSIYIFVLLLNATGIVAQSTGQNYILTRVYQSADSTKYLDQIQYFDGLGRPVETVQKAQSSKDGTTWVDLVNLTEYDGFGREYKHWLPVPSSGYTGAYVSPTDFALLANSEYNNGEKPYATTDFEATPLNRVTGKYGAGASWYAAKKNDSILYQTNVASEAAIAHFYVYDTTHLARDVNNYAANTLYKTQTMDEDGKIAIEYKDKQGLVVMKQSSTDAVKTYYVYNDLGQLAYVLPPIASDLLPSSFVIKDDNGILQRYAYLYKYDERGNNVIKRLPGCDNILKVYDKANRLVMSQDGNQRLKYKWIVTKYDVLGRVLYNGILNREVSQLEKDFINHNVIIESYTGSISFYSTGYSNNLFKSEIIPLTVNYYDNYDFITLNGISLKWVIPITGYGTQYTNAKGLLTGMRTYILDKAGINYTTNAMYYDDRGRVVQTHNKNHLGGYDHVYNQYDFIGHITKTYKEHSQNTSTVIRELYRNVYDQAGRLVLTRYFLSSYNDTITLVSNSYDDLGRLIKKQRHNNTDNETIDYNIRNWATKITSGTFIEELFYNINNISNISPCFNGNISATTWTYNGVKKAYSYTYNDLNQLTIAQGYQVDGNYLLNPNNKEQFYYDKQGNIVSMTRQKDNISKLLDDLSFHYNGNQVTSVDDYSGSLNLYATKEYYEKSRANNEMTYDPNGNMIKDLDRDIVTIQYNILNLPDTIQFKNGNQIINKYDASGQKLRTDYFTRITAITPIDPGKICAWTYTANEVDQTGTAYVDNKEYTFTGSQSGIFTLKRIHNAEGYVDFNWGSTNYNYYRRDHLGNIREVWGRTPGGFLTVQQTQYYPSGLPWTEGTGASLQPFKYNNKEFIEMNGYDTYDYGARGYYPAMGRFTSMDPLAEIDYSVSPYAYCKGNPVNRIDPTGMWTETDTGYTTNDPNEISDFFNQQKNNNHEEKIEKPDPINNLKEEFLNFFGWDLNPANPDDRKQMEEGSKNRVKAAKDIKEVNKFLIINGVLFFTGEGVSYCIEEVGGAIIVRLLSKEAMNAAEVGGEALTQFNSVESLLEGAGTLNKVKAGMQGFVPGDGASIFKTLIKNGTKQANGTYILEDGTTLFSHFSTKTGVYTIDINKAGQIFKIRIGQ